MSDNIVVNGNNNELYEQICNILLTSRNKAYTAVNETMVQAYWLIGKTIVEDEQNGNQRAEYGKETLHFLSSKLTEEFGRGFSVRTLQQLKKFYVVYPNTNALRSHLNWTHYRNLIKIKSAEARSWYEGETIKSQWLSRQLERQISALYYERLLSSHDKAQVIEEAEQKLSKIAPEEFIKDPYVLEFLNVKEYPSLCESELEQALIDHLQEFLLELGRGLCFVARQKLMRFDDDDFYLDLVFYHSVLKCYILIDLKIGKLTHQDVGQMDSYIRMFDALQKNGDDNPTLGIVLCSEPNETIAKYSILNDSKQLFASKYIYNIPTIEELQDYINDQRRIFEEGEGNQ